MESHAQPTSSHSSHSSAAGAEGGALATLEARSLRKRFDLETESAGEIAVLSGVDLTLHAGESLAVMGPSGSGKSTLLHLFGLLDQPSGGDILWNGTSVLKMKEGARTKLRNSQVGFVFQDHYLLPQCSAIENVLLPTLAAGKPLADNEKRANQLLGRVGLEHRKAHLPSQLSGGERQRVALARALIMKPSLLLCDEPTGNLDHSSASLVADLLLELQRTTNVTLVVVTHSRELADRFATKRVLTSGKLEPA